MARMPIAPIEAQILVVEDNERNYVLIARMLALMGVPRCEWKTSGWQVSEFADKLTPLDLILLDIHLPHEDGYLALQRLRSNERLNNTRIVAITADTGEEQMTKARKAGFDSFLGKPLDADRFPGQIQRILSGNEVWEWK